MAEHIRNPIEWSVDQLAHTAHAVASAGRAAHHATLHTPAPAVRRIAIGDLREVLEKGVEDFAAYRADVIFICAIYPIIGIVLGRLAFGEDLLPLLFPLASGFTLVGPIAAVGLYEMSRRREQGATIGWADAFGVVRSPRFAAIFLLGLVLAAIFLAWLVVATLIYDATLGPMPPASLASFAHDVLATPAGWAMIAIGVGAGFLFAVLVLAISVVSFPLLLDREAGLDTAVMTSIRAVATNPLPMALWGLIVAGSLVLGTLPLFIGLIIVMPVLGHATWHLYRKLVVR
jgi:uncharacterized membrane protein